MKDQKTLACVNLIGVFGAIPKLCELDADARKLIDGVNTSIGFEIKDTASATLFFENGACRFEQGCERSDILLGFTAEKFNLLIDGKYTPIPKRGFTKLGFLLHGFTKLTDILTRYLRASQNDLKDDEFFKKSTVLMLHVIAGAISAIGNNDKVGKASASYIVDGVIKLSIKDCEAVGILAQNHVLTPVHSDPVQYLSCMEFENIKLARDLFDGKVNAVVCVGKGQVVIKGMISQIDNVNRILDRVAVYLA